MKNDEWSGILNFVLITLEDIEKAFNRRFGWFFTNGRKQDRWN